MTADDVRGEDYEAAKPVPARSRVTGDPWVSGHLPECRRWFADMPAPDECPACEMFRACEQRVRRDVDDVWVTQHDDRITWEWKGDTGYALVQREVLELLLARCNETTYAAGVQAARDAVDAACGWRPAGRCSECTHALAAIDALRGEHA